MTTNEFRGAKYDSNLSRKQIAVLVRGEIKAAIKSGAIPAGTKVSVTIGGYKSVDIRIKAFPGPVESPAFVLARRGFNLWPHDPPFISKGGTDRYAPAFGAVVDLIEAMLTAYNRDNSDSQTDYFDTNFYSHVTPCSELVKAQTAELLAAKAEFLADLAITVAGKAGEERAFTIGDYCRSEAA